MWRRRRAGGRCHGQFDIGQQRQRAEGDLVMTLAIATPAGRSAAPAGRGDAGGLEHLGQSRQQDELGIATQAASASGDPARK